MSSQNSSKPKRRGRRLNSHINVVPYIDVMLVLLVIFMVTTPLLTPSVVNLPQVNQAAATNPIIALEVVIQKDGRLQLVDKDPARAFEQTTTLQDLPALAQGRMQPNEARPVVISADKGVIYDTVLTVMDHLKTAGIERIGLSVVAKTNP